MGKAISKYVKESPEWCSILYLFTEHPKLASIFTSSYIDLTKEHVYTRKLNQISKYWSESEKFMLALALHLYNPTNKLPKGLAEMERLDHRNMKLALKAISIRYQS